MHLKYISIACGYVVSFSWVAPIACSFNLRNNEYMAWNELRIRSLTVCITLIYVLYMDNIFACTKLHYTVYKYYNTEYFKNQKEI